MCLFKDRLKDINLLRGAVGYASQHYLVEPKLKVKTMYWRGGRKEGEGMRRGREVIRPGEPGERRRLQEKIEKN